jgi:hypothetical protein
VDPFQGLIDLATASQLAIEDREKTLTFVAGLYRSVTTKAVWPVMKRGRFTGKFEAIPEEFREGEGFKDWATVIKPALRERLQTLRTQDWEAVNQNWEKFVGGRAMSKNLMIAYWLNRPVETWSGEKSGFWDTMEKKVKREIEPTRDIATAEQTMRDFFSTTYQDPGTMLNAIKTVGEIAAEGSLRANVKEAGKAVGYSSLSGALFSANELNWPQRQMAYLDYRIRTALPKWHPAHRTPREFIEAFRQRVSGPGWNAPQTAKNLDQILGIYEGGTEARQRLQPEIKAQLEEFGRRDAAIEKQERAADNMGRAAEKLDRAADKWLMEGFDTPAPANTARRGLE